MKFKSCLKVGATTFELACGRHAASTQQDYTVSGFIVRKTMDKLLCALLAATIVTISGCAQFPINTQPTDCGSFPSSASDTAGPKNC